MKTYQYREMSTTDIENELKQAQEALLNYRFQHATSQLENFKAVKNTRLDIAKMRTILKERAMGINERLDKSKKESK